jgi:hypothetical protein
MPVGDGLYHLLTQPLTELHHTFLTCPPWPTRLGEEGPFPSLTQVIKQYQILQARQAGGKMGKNGAFCMSELINIRDHNPHIGPWQSRFSECRSRDSGESPA